MFTLYTKVKVHVESKHTSKWHACIHYIPKLGSDTPELDKAQELISKLRQCIATLCPSEETLRSAILGEFLNIA